MHVEPKTAGMVSAGAFLFLLIFGVGWPGPGAWLLIFALMLIGVAGVAWWMDSAGVERRVGAVSTAGGGHSPFGGRTAGAIRRGPAPSRRGDSLLLTLGLPGPDAQGRWLLPSRVHITLLAGAVGSLALIIFVAGAIGGGGSAAAPQQELSELPSNPAIDFARPLDESGPAAASATTDNSALDTGTPTTSTLPQPQGTAASSADAGSPIVVDTPEPARPAPARPIQVNDDVGTQPGHTVIHEVVEGDTIYDIAIHYETSIEAIMNANGIGEYDTIHVGDRLIVPTNAPE